MDVLVLTRNISRDTGLTLKDWKEFFAKDKTPFVYLAHTANEPIDKLCEREAKAYITNVTYQDDSFEYTLHLLDGWTEEDFYNFYVEPIYGLVMRDGKPVAAEIRCLELIPTTRVL